MPRLKEKYIKEIRPALKAKFKYKSTMQIPGLEKVVLSMGVGEVRDNPKAMDSAVNDIMMISGQRPVVTKAKKSVASFKVRQGMNIGCMVTLRGNRMYEFTDKLFNIGLPRVRDFRGISPNSFDGRGNFSIGIKEQIIFPEINYDSIDRIRGLNITFVTTARTDEEAKELLQLLGMPFVQT
jgi:large subunit ribosomal protein L5